MLGISGNSVIRHTPLPAPTSATRSIDTAPKTTTLEDLLNTDTTPRPTYICGSLTLPLFSRETNYTLIHTAGGLLASAEMPSASASGADATPNGSAKSREHNQGNQDRKYTVEQKVAVIRVRKCSATAFYEILGLERTVSDAEIKKAYRKLSLLTHPDKNGYDGADEAFKST